MKGYVCADCGSNETINEFHSERTVMPSKKVRYGLENILLCKNCGCEFFKKVE